MGSFLPPVTMRTFFFPSWCSTMLGAPATTLPYQESLREPLAKISLYYVNISKASSRDMEVAASLWFLGIRDFIRFSWRALGNYMAITTMLLRVICILMMETKRAHYGRTPEANWLSS